MTYEFFKEPMFGIAPDILNWIVLGVAALLVLLILYLLIRLIRRPRLASGRRSRQARLAITDAALIDERRKLVLVRRDDVEHLIMIGGANDLLIEADIRKTEPARPLAEPDPASDSVNETPAPVAQTVVAKPVAATPAPAPVAVASEKTPDPTPPAPVTAPRVERKVSVSHTPAASTPPAKPVEALGAATAVVAGAAATVTSTASEVVESAEKAGAELSDKLSSSASTLSASPSTTQAPAPASGASVSTGDDSVIEPPKRTSLSDDMSALLDEISPKK